MGQFKATVKGAAVGLSVGLAAGAATGAIIGAFAGTGAAPGVGTLAGAFMGNVIGGTVGAIGGAATFFIANVIAGTRRMTDFPPISTVLAQHGRRYLLDSMSTAIAARNQMAINHFGRELTKMGLNRIYMAFIRGAQDALRCSTCHQNMTNFDEMCYCPMAADNCHHNSGLCCRHRRRPPADFAQNS